ncbi:MAG TPA: thiol-disulfide oxidoreductase DCC family protein [bacterium]|nr:thiol-disulfide oxidoreductase DCC family protein [bacterium]
MDSKEGVDPGDAPILLFDGHCGLCNAFVDFVLRRDKKKTFLFAPLQSPQGLRLRGSLGVPDRVDSIILVEGGLAYVRSAAALRVARRLPWPWPAFWVLVALPRGLRDAVYDAIARRRYAWFGRRERCRVPNEEERRRFLDD